jgi:hypothetical protein
MVEIKGERVLRRRAAARPAKGMEVRAIRRARALAEDGGSSC